MEFFDLNMPYEPSQSSKPTRIKTVIKAIELGYTGIAFNHTIKGVMSDHDRCFITPLSLSSLLNLAPSLSSSINLHRDLLNVPRASPFRQYTRLTVCVDTPAQCHVLNSRNMILKSYDVIAVRPVNQLAFDYACEKSEVDIIAINFSEKLPFRIKSHVVKAAIERGVYFEIAYSDLIVDVQVRRQMISNAKLLVDWTRGRNLVISSAAPSVNELRGPYDVANLSSLLGLSMERAKVAISKNCRNLLANALKKRHFYRDTIRVEPLSLDGKSDSKDPFSLDWLRWDPISSGDGDLRLEDIAESFSATHRVSNSVKPIDFASVINSIQSHGANILTAVRAAEVPVTTTGASERADGHDLPGTVCMSCCNELKNQTPSFASSQPVFISSDAITTSTRFEEIGAPTNTAGEEPKISHVSNAVLPSLVIQKHDLQLQDFAPCELKSRLENEDAMHQTCATENGLSDACADTKTETLSGTSNFLGAEIEKSRNSDAVFGAQDVVDSKVEEMGTKDQENIHVTENISGREQFGHSEDATITSMDKIILTSLEMDIDNVSSVTNCEKLHEVIMEEHEHGDANLGILMGAAMEKEEYTHADAEIGQDNDFNAKDDFLGCEAMHLKNVAVEEQQPEADTGKPKSKRRIPLLFPLKRMLNPIPLRRKSKKFKHKMKL